jgi:hypothetical protein
MVGFEVVQRWKVTGGRREGWRVTLAENLDGTMRVIDGMMQVEGWEWFTYATRFGPLPLPAVPCHLARGLLAQRAKERGISMTGGLTMALCP